MIELSQSVLLKLSQIDVNSGQIEGLPANPRFIRNEKFRKLVKSIGENPEMLSMRELLVYPYRGRHILIGGNMRYRALKELGYKEAPCKVIPETATAEQLKAYTLKDNSGFGEWDFDMLANEWDLNLIEDCAIDIPRIEEGVSGEYGQESEDEGEEKSSDENEDPDEDFFRMMLGDRIYNADNDFDIPSLLKSEMPTSGLLLPFHTWGADSRQKKTVGTYHFYVDDYRFEALWKDPVKLLNTGCQAVVEPNLSLFDTTPVAYGLHLIYKKRWISRYWQECGVKVFADLNVAYKFRDYNRMGIPDGYDAFATRGYAERLEYLADEVSIARSISGKDVPNMIVYGGGKAVRDYCVKHGLVYVEQFMKNKGGETDG